jgi:hypothetical protein
MIVVVKKFVRLENILQHHHVSLKSRKIISHLNTFQDTMNGEEQPQQFHILITETVHPAKTTRVVR